MHTPTTSAFDIDPSRIIEELNKLPPFDANESKKPPPKTGDIEELKKHLSASMVNAAFKDTDKP
jgi:hypothetical protein